MNDYMKSFSLEGKIALVTGASYGIGFAIAKAFAAAGAADEGVQAKLSARAVCRYLRHKYDHPEALAGQAAKMKALATPDAAARVADLVTGAGGSAR